ncbi:MAG: hypothetical protein ACRDEA_10300, partial [Microcystaceae cyanobacterium]
MPKQNGKVYQWIQLKREVPMKNYQKLLRNIMIASLIAAVALPTSVHASVQPTDSQTRNEETSPTTDDGGWLQIPAIVSTAQDIFRNISAGNISGAINGVLGILGELGLLDPADESARVGAGVTNPDSSSSGNPYSNPQSPEEVYELQRYVDLVRSEIPQKLSQMVFGPQGQTALAQQSQSILQAQQASLEAQQGVNDAYTESKTQAEQNADAAQRVSAEAGKAQSAKASQDVLKALAAQNEDLAQISSGTSAQLAQLGIAASYESAQL